MHLACLIHRQQPLSSLEQLSRTLALSINMGRVMKQQVQTAVCSCKPVMGILHN